MELKVRAEREDKGAAIPHLGPGQARHFPICAEQTCPRKEKLSPQDWLGPRLAPKSSTATPLGQPLVQEGVSQLWPLGVLSPHCRPT